MEEGLGLRREQGRSKPVLVGVLVAASWVVAYTSLVVIATPDIRWDLTLRLALSANWPYVGLVSGASALQAYLFVYSRSLPCKLTGAKAVGTTSSALASFTSFFGLTSVGCCGLLPLWVSIALGGGTMGLGASVFLVNNSFTLTIFGLASMLAAIVFTVTSIRKSLNMIPKDHASKSEMVEPAGGVRR